MCFPSLVMEKLSEQQRRDIIVNFYRDHEADGKSHTVKHFVAMGVPKRSIYSVLARFQQTQTTKRKQGSGRPAVKLPKPARKRLVKAAADKKGVSSTKLAQKFGVERSYVSKVLAKNNCKWLKREKAPQVTPEQEETQRARCRKLSRDIFPPSLPTSIVMDDESYFGYKHDEIPGNVGYYTQNKENTPPAVRFRTKTKFPAKLLVWIAISDKGRSEPFFVPNHGSVNGEVYRNDCITQRLIPFLQEHHSDGDYVFWPDLASAHYANATQELFRENDIPFVPKDSNPPNAPQLRPIEDLWSWLKQLVYEGGWEAQTEDQLRRRIRACLRKVDWDRIRTALRRVKSDIRKAADHGVMAVHH